MYFILMYFFKLIIVGSVVIYKYYLFSILIENIIYSENLYIFVYNYKLLIVNGLVYIPAERMQLIVTHEIH